MPQVSQVERDLAEIERASRRGLADKLYEDHDAGFQLFDSNDDQTKAVGVRVFKVGKQTLYAPIFYTDGDLKGEELLIIKDSNLVVPFDKSWVDFILANKPIELGEPSKGPKEPSRPALTSFMDLGQQTGISVGQVKSASLLEAYEAANEAGKEAFVSVLLRAPKAAAALLNEVEGLEKAIRRSVKRAKSRVSLFESEPGQRKEAVELVRDLSEAKNPQELSDIVRKGYSIRDKRAQAEKKVVSSLVGKLFIPQEAGFYSAYTTGGTRRVLFIPPRTTIDWETGEKHLTGPIAAKQEKALQSDIWKALVESLPSIKSIKPGDYIVLPPTPGEPIEVHAKDVVRLPDGQIRIVGFDVTILVSDSAGAVELKAPNSSAWGEKIRVLPSSYKIRPIKAEILGADKPFLQPSEAVSLFGEPVIAEKSASQIVVRLDGRKTAFLRRSDAVYHLVKAGLSVYDAEKLLDELSERPIAVGLMEKKAQEPETLPVESATETSEPVGAAPQTALDLADTAEGLAEKDEVELAKELLGVSALSAAVSTSEPTEGLKKYVPDLIIALDKLGRLLIKLYSQYDELEEELGASKLEALEERLQEAFKLIGQLVLELKETFARDEVL